MKRTAIYLRVSTISQDYDRQKSELLGYCTRNNLQVSYVFEEKMSGAIDDRPEFQRMLTLTDIDVILVWELSRLGRRMSTVISMVEDMAKRGVCVIALKESFKSLDDNGAMTPSTIMMLSFGSAMAEIERTSIKERTKSGRREKILSGKRTYTNQAPLGYDMSNGQLVINSDSEKIKEIFNLYKEGRTLDFISKLFNISRACTYKILKNEVYSGRRFSKSINGYVNTPQIIDTELFNEVQELLSSNRRIFKKSENNHPLKTKLFCWLCGGMMSRHGGEKNPVWGCGCGHTTLHFKYADGATEVALDQVRKVIGIEHSRTEIENQITALYKQAADQSEYVDNIYDQIKDTESKIEVLKSVFTADKLKNEVSEVNKLKSQYQKESKILKSIFSEIAMKEESLSVNKVDVSMVSRIDVQRIDKHHKVLVFHILDQIVKVLVDYSNNIRPKYTLWWDD